ncbi:hypothetical protein, partial [Bartonella sp. CL41QHWL]|uniref:hypothetical protein n=1 Tax=Bartonella sp. CL41QHWL TaxID=3243527 RepID=UPI0035D029D1
RNVLKSRNLLIGSFNNTFKSTQSPGDKVATLQIDAALQASIVMVGLALTNCVRVATRSSSDGVFEQDTNSRTLFKTSDLSLRDLSLAFDDGMTGLITLTYWADRLFVAVLRTSMTPS